MKVTMDNYEEYLLRQVDGELDAEERAALNAFLETHPACREELGWLEKTRLRKEEAPLRYPGKASLYRGEKALPVLRRGWLRYAAAAAVLLLGLLYWRPWVPATQAPAVASRTNPLPDSTTPEVTPAPVPQARERLANGDSQPPEEQAATALSGPKRLPGRPAAARASLASARPSAASSRPESADVKPKEGRADTTDLAPDHAAAPAALPRPLPPLAALAENKVAATVDSPALVAVSPVDQATPPGPAGKTGDVGDRILLTAESLNEAKGRMDDALTEKIYDIHDKTSGFLENIQKNGLRIGHITFAINN